jgi:membrane protease YdiL (CAAX protease family)
MSAKTNTTNTISPRVNPNVTRPYYHGSVLYVRTDGETSPRACSPADLAEGTGAVTIGAETPISLRREGPFEPFAVAIATRGTLRDALAPALGAPSVAAFRRVRPVLAAAAILCSLAALELDRELVWAGAARPGRLLAHLALAAFVAFELTRKTPRLPGVAAASLVTLALSWTLIATRHCGRGVHPLVYGLAAASAVTAAAILARAPSRRRVTLEIAAKVGLSRSDLFRATLPPHASSALVGASLVAAVGLPGALYLARRSGAPLELQALVFVAYAAVVPELVRRALDGAERAKEAAARLVAGDLVWGIGVGLALTVALMHGSEWFFASGTELARCVNRLDAEASRLAAARSRELTSALAAVRGSTMMVIMTVAIVPLAEERVFRGLLQPVLTRKYGRAYGLFGTAVVFGLAHFGVYHLAVYETVLLGLAFGVAYAEGGLVAAFVVHAVWNLLQLA